MELDDAAYVKSLVGHGHTAQEIAADFDRTRGGTF
jgi:hypothetical protein